MSTAVRFRRPRTSLATLPIDQRRGIMACGRYRHGGHALRVHVWRLLLSRQQQGSLGRGVAPKLMFLFFCDSASSSFVLHWGEKQVKSERFGLARAALWITVAAGPCLSGTAGFRVLLPLERTATLQRLLRIDLLHHHYAPCAHVIVGLLMLAYVGIHAALRLDDRVPPHKPYSHDRALLAFRRCCVGLYRRAAVRHPQFPEVHHVH